MSKPGRAGTGSVGSVGVFGKTTFANDYLNYESATGDPHVLKGSRRSSQSSLGGDSVQNFECPTLPPGAQPAPEYAASKLMGAVEGALTDMLDAMPANNHVGTLSTVMRAYGEHAMGASKSGYAKRMIPIELPLDVFKGSYAEKVRERLEAKMESSLTIGSGSTRSSSRNSDEHDVDGPHPFNIPTLDLPSQSPDKIKLNILLEPRSQQKASLQNEGQTIGTIRRLSSGALQRKLAEMASNDELGLSLRPSTTDIRPLPTNCTRAGRLPLFGLHCPHINDIEQTCKHLYDEGFRKHVTVLFCLEGETVFIDGVPHVGNKWRSTCQEYGTKIPFTPFEEALQNAILDSDISNESTATGMKTYANCDTLDDVVEHVSLKCKVKRIACARLALPDIYEHPHPFLSIDLVDALNKIADRFVVSQSPEAALIVCNFSPSPLPMGLIQSCLGTALYAHSDRFTVYTLDKQIPERDSFQSVLLAHDEALIAREARDKRREIITANLRRRLTADDTPPERRQGILERIKLMHEAELTRIARRAEEDDILASLIRRRDLNSMMSIQAMARGYVVRFRRRQQKKLEAKKFSDVSDEEPAMAYQPQPPAAVQPVPPKSESPFNTDIVSPHNPSLMAAGRASSILVADGSLLVGSGTFKMDSGASPVPMGRRRRRVTVGEDADAPVATESDPTSSLPLASAKLRSAGSPAALKDALMDLKAEKAKAEQDAAPKKAPKFIDPKVRLRNEALYAPLRHVIRDLYDAYPDSIAIDPPYRGKSVTKKVSVWSHQLTRIKPTAPDDISSEDEEIEMNTVDTFTASALKSLKPVNVSSGTGMALNRQYKDVVDPHRIVLNLMRDCNCDQRGFLFSVFTSFTGSSNLQKKAHRTLRDMATLLVNSIYCLLASVDHTSIRDLPVKPTLSNWLVRNHPRVLSKLSAPDLLTLVTPVGGVPRVSKVGPCQFDVQGPNGAGWAVVAAKLPEGAPLPWMTLAQMSEATSQAKSTTSRHFIDMRTFLTDGCISARTARSQHTGDWWYTHFVAEEAKSEDAVKTLHSFFHRSIPVFAFYEPLPAPKWQEIASNMPFYSSSKWISTTRNYVLYIDDIPYALVRRSLEKTLVPTTAAIRPQTPPRPKTPPVRVSPRRQTSHPLGQKLEPKPPSENRVLGRSNSGVHLPTTATIARLASTLGPRGSFRSGSKTASHTPIGGRKKKKSQGGSDSSGEDASPLEDLSDLTGFGHRPLHHKADIFTERNSDITVSEKKWLSEVSWVEAEARFAAHLLRAAPKDSGLFPAFEPTTCGDVQTNNLAYTLDGCNLAEIVVKALHPPPPVKAEKHEPIPSFGLARRRTQRLNVEIVSPEANNTSEKALSITSISPPDATPILVRGYTTAVKDTILKRSPVDAHFLRCPIVAGTSNYIDSFSAVIQEVRTASSSAAIGIGLDSRDNVIVLGIALVTSCHEKGLCDMIVDEVKDLMMPPAQTASPTSVSFGDEGKGKHPQNHAMSLLHTHSMRMPHTMKVLPFVNALGQLFADEIEDCGIKWEDTVTFVDSLLTRTGLYSQLRQPIDDLLAFNEEVRLGNIHITERHERLAVRRRIVEAIRIAEGYMLLLLTHAFLTSRWSRQNPNETFAGFIEGHPFAQNAVRHVDIFAGTNKEFKLIPNENGEWTSETPVATYLDIDEVSRIGRLSLDMTSGPIDDDSTEDSFWGGERSIRHREVGFLVDPHYGTYTGWDQRWAGAEGFINSIQ